MTIELSEKLVQLMYLPDDGEFDNILVHSPRQIRKKKLENYAAPYGNCLVLNVGFELVAQERPAKAAFNLIY